jgi:hypothetical protein
MLVEAMRGRLDRKIGHALTGELVERAVQLDRIWRGQGAVDLARGRHQADGADARRLLAGRGPDLACEGGDRGLAAGAGNRRDRVRLAGKEFGRSVRQRAPRIADLDEGDTGRQRRRRHPLGHDGDRAARHRKRNEAQPVILRARHRHEQVARFDGSAVRSDPAHVERGKAHIGASTVSRLASFMAGQFVPIYRVGDDITGSL